MKFKRGASITLTFLSAIVLFFVSMSFVNASSYGVRPAYYTINFEPNFEGDFVFNFFTSSPETNLAITTQGDLSKYVSVNPAILSGEGGAVNVHVKLPSYIDKPGKHGIYVAAEPIVSETTGGTAVGIVGVANGAILVNVPYPGKYAEIEFKVENANAGEGLPYQLKIYSRGDEELTTTSRIDIFDYRNKSVKSIPLGTNTIPSGEFIEKNSQFDSAGLGAGNYIARAVVSYSGGEANAEDEFKLGELNVAILNYTSEVKRNSINPFFVEVESLWNDPIENLFADVSVIGKDLSFTTPSIRLEPWQTTRVTGYLDTNSLKEIKEDSLQARVVVNYGNKTTEEVVNLRFMKEGINFITVGVIAAVVFVVALIGLLIWIGIKFRNLEKKSGKKKK